MSFLLAVMKFYLPDFSFTGINPISFNTLDILLSGAHHLHAIYCLCRTGMSCVAKMCTVMLHHAGHFLAGEEYRATQDVWLCPQTRLLADSPQCRDFVYNGQGHRLILPEGIGDSEALPLIIVGAGKTLLLQNVKIVHAASLPSCLQLGSGQPCLYISIECCVLHMKDISEHLPAIGRHGSRVCSAGINP
jgi:hypothetical protein